MAGNAGNGSGRPRPLWITALWCTAAFVLPLPLVAMQFTAEVNWTVFDFVVFGTMLVLACGTCELAARATGNAAYCAAVGVAVASAFLLVWINLSVGIIGTENNPANLVYGGVLAVGIIGARIARFRPQGMTRALVATALAQALITTIVLIAGWDSESVILTAFFVVPWLASGWLFSKAAGERKTVGAVSQRRESEIR